MNPYTKEDYEIFEKMYMENLIKSHSEFYELILKFVFGKTSNA